MTDALSLMRIMGRTVRHLAWCGLCAGCVTHRSAFIPLRSVPEVSKTDRQTMEQRLQDAYNAEYTALQWRKIAFQYDLSVHDSRSHASSHKSSQSQPHTTTPSKVTP
jgi:hypothetical protein